VTGGNAEGFSLAILHKISSDVMPFFEFYKPKPKKSKSPGRSREPRLMSGAGDDDDEGKEYSPSATAQKTRPRRKSPHGKAIKIWLAGLFFRLSLTGAFLTGLFFAYIYLTLPDISTLADVKKTPSIIVKAEDGSVLGSYGDVYGDYIPYAQFPKYLVNAVVATEDRNFFHHFGVDPLGMLRAAFVNLRARHLVQGGSTITQQVAKNVFLTPERTLRRKLEEMALALELERHYSKQEILTIYLNRVYMGAGTYGVDAASRRYFDHSVRQAGLSEAAILVGLLKAPSRYAPTSNPDLSEKRATQVLLNMKDAGYLTQAQVDAAKSDFGDEDSGYRDNHSFGAFYFSDYVVGLLPQYIGDYKGDIVVTTTLRPQWQHIAEDTVNGVMDARGKALRASQAALVSMTPDGAIRAMVGGRNYRASQFNRVTQALRQPGSSFKLFVYLAGLEAGFTPDSEMVDEPVNIGKWRPRDYSGKYQGRMALRAAFAESINSIAIQLSETVGRSKVVDMAHLLGITTEMEPDPSIALGTNEVTLLDMTRAYAHLAANGESVVPYAITRIDTADGQKMYERAAPVPAEVLRPAIVRMMNNMLLAVTQTGTGRGAQFGRPVAGKTGTTSDYRDAWFMGFTPELVTGVWVGNDDTAPMKKVTGGSLPASIWRQYMAGALKGVPVAEIPNQEGPGLLGQLLPWLGSGQEPASLPSGNGQSVPSGVSTPDPLQSLQSVQARPQPAVQDQPPQQAQGAIPEEEPAPAYNAPQSFWDKLLGDGDKER
jgi:penicillin-binding protein 1A